MPKKKTEEDNIEEDKSTGKTKEESDNLAVKDTEEKADGKDGGEKKKKISKKEEDMLLPLNDYLKSGIYIGTKVITPHMRPYVYRRRADGIAILNTTLIDQKIREAAVFLSKYAPQDFIIVCKREGGWRAVKLFSELTGVKVFTKKYPAGIITNLSLPDFFETEMIFICDPWLDKNALADANKVGSKVMSLCDTNNLTFGVDTVIPCNNKTNKSLGVIFYLLAKEYLKARKMDKQLPGIEEFIGEKLDKPTSEETEAKSKETVLEREKAKIEERFKSLSEKEEKESAGDGFRRGIKKMPKNLLTS